MVIFKDTHRFEITVNDVAGEWRATLREFIPGRLYPTEHLLRSFASRQAAIEALVRKWQVLFPEEAPLAWHEPPAMSVSPRPGSSRRPGRAPQPAGRRPRAQRPAKRREGRSDDVR